MCTVIAYGGMDIDGGNVWRTAFKPVTPFDPHTAGPAPCASDAPEPK